MRILLLFSLLFIAYSAQSQGYSRKKKDCFPQSPRFEKSHWYFGPGINYTLTPFGTKQVNGTQEADTLFRSNLSRSGDIGFYAEFGRYWLIERLYFFRYWNAGINWRWVKGTESYTDERVVLDVPTTLISGQNTFSDHYVNLHCEINGINRLSDESFIQHTLGAAGGYAIGSSRSYTHSVPGVEERTNNRVHSYLYYRIGYGFKSNKKLIIIPSVEIPVLNVFDFHDARPDMPYFNSGFWPITFSVRFFLFRPYRLKDCPPVDAIGLPEGFDPDEPSKNK